MLLQGDDPSAFGMPTAVLGAKEPVAMAFAAGFLLPDIHQDRADADVGTSVQHFRGFFESSRLCILFLFNFFVHIWSYELRRR